MRRMVRLRRWLAAGSLASGCSGSPLESASDTHAEMTDTTAFDEPTTTTTTTTTGSPVTDAADTTDSPDHGDGSSGAVSSTTDSEPAGSSSSAAGSDAIGSSDSTATEASDDESTEDAEGCEEPDEPNDDEASAWPLPDLACDAEPTMLESTAHWRTGSDWFVFWGAWDNVSCGFGQGQAHARVLDGDVAQVCAFASCPNAAALVGCLQGLSSISPDGLHGCCGKTDAELDVNCDPDLDESATVFVRVDHDDLDCAPYSLELAY